MILDQPTNGLDPAQILHMRELVGEFALRATVIVSTHILQEVQATCRRVVILRSGRVVTDARMDELQQGARLLVTLDRNEQEARPVLQAVPGWHRCSSPARSATAIAMRWGSRPTPRPR